MSSRNYVKHVVSSTVPANPNAGDEYYDPTTNQLYKSVISNGTTLGTILITTGGLSTNTVNAASKDTLATQVISNGVLNIDVSTGTVFNVSVTQPITNIVITNIPSLPFIAAFVLVFEYDGNPYSVTWPTAVRWPGGTAPTLTNTASKRDIFTIFTYDGGTTYNGIISALNL